MPNFTVGKYLAARFEQIGLKHYFMVPGDYNLVLLDELLENDEPRADRLLQRAQRGLRRRGLRPGQRRRSRAHHLQRGRVLRAERGGRRLRRTPSGDRGFLGAQHE